MKRGRMCICVRTRARGKKNKEERKKVVCFAFQEVTMTHTHTEKHGKKHLWLHVLWQQENSLNPPLLCAPPPFHLHDKRQLPAEAATDQFALFYF